MISVVIPTLSEADEIARTLRSIGDRDDVEVVISDGGSDDGTLAIARRLADRVVGSPLGRGVQMNRGAAVARGDVLLFLHADTRLGPGALDAIAAARRAGFEAGAFRLGVESPRRIYRLLELMVNLRSAMLGLPYGDQAIWMTREVYDRIGGFREIALLEDLEMVLGLRAAGVPMTILDPPVATSARRWEREGVLATSVRNLFVAILYAAGLRSSGWVEFFGRVLGRTPDPMSVVETPATDRVVG